MRVFVSRRVGPFRMGASFGPRDFRRGRQAAYQQPSSGDHVYIVEGNGAVKIGVTGDLQARLAQLQTGSPYPLRLAYSTPVWGDAYAVEAEAHAMLDRHRLAGEWFGVPADVAVAAVNGAAFRLAPSNMPEPRSANWLKRALVVALVFTPQWILLGSGRPLGFVLCFFIAMMGITIGMLKNEAAGNIGLFGFAKWCGALVFGLVISIVAGLILSSSISHAHASDDIPHTPANFISHDGATFCSTKDQLGEYIKAIKAHDEAWAFSVGCSRLIPDSRIVTLDTINLGPNATVHAAHIRALNLDHFGETGYILVFDPK